VFGYLAPTIPPCAQSYTLQEKPVWIPVSTVPTPALPAIYGGQPKSNSYKMYPLMQVTKQLSNFSSWVIQGVSAHADNQTTFGLFATAHAT